MSLKNILKNNTIVALLLLCSSLVVFSAPSEKKTLYSKLQRINMGSLEWEEEEWPHEQFNEYLARCLRYQQEPQAFKKRKAVFTLFNEAEKQKGDVVYDAVLDDVVTWEDLALFRGSKDETKDVYLGNKLNRTLTEFGRVQFFRMLAEPTVDIAKIEQRQQIIKELATNDKLYNDLLSTFQELKKTENLLISFYGNDPLYNSAGNFCYVNIPSTRVNDTFNYNTTALKTINCYEYSKRLTFFAAGVAASIVLPLYGLSRLTNRETSFNGIMAKSFGVEPKEFREFSNSLVGYGDRVFALLSLFDNKWVKGAACIASGVYCASRLKKDYLWAKAHLDMLACIQTKMIDVAAFMESAQHVNSLVKTSQVLTNNTQTSATFTQLFEKLPAQNAHIAELLHLLQSSTFKGEPSAFSHHGNILVGFKLMHENKDVFKQLLMTLGELDAYLSVATLYREHQSKKAVFSFANLETAAHPHIELKEFWNPFIDADKVQTSSVTIGGAHPRALIITGSNEGGKSTFIKAVAFNLIMAQSFGVGPAAHITITPFSSIATYLNITDDIGQGNSLFKNQVSRTQYLISRTEKLSADQFSLLAIDEVFNGTSHIEASAAAYSFARYTGNFANCISLFATHYPIMNKLAKENSSVFANYRIRVEGEGENKMRTFEPGISEQHLAINMLRTQGFNSKILEDAQMIIEQGGN